MARCRLARTLGASRWHSEIVSQSVEGFSATVTAAGYARPEIVEVPGAFEIPLTVQRLARSGEYAVIDALMQVQLATDVSVLSGVLTPLNFHEHEEHVAYFTRHFRLKGEELGTAAMSVLDGGGN